MYRNKPWLNKKEVFRRRWDNKGLIYWKVKLVDPTSDSTMSYSLKWIKNNFGMFLVMVFHDKQWHSQTHCKTSGKSFVKQNMLCIANITFWKYKTFICIYTIKGLQRPNLTDKRLYIMVHLMQLPSFVTRDW